VITVFEVSLEAHDPSKNLARSYSLRVGQDLFGAWQLELQHGRIGTRGRVRHLAFDTPASVRAEVRRRLKRRESAPRRIGASYQVIAVEGLAWLAEPAQQSG